MQPRDLHDKGGGGEGWQGAGGKVARAGLSPSDLVLREGFKQERDWTDVCLGQVDEERAFLAEAPA